ncbi:tRNA pseudouridine(55) synthase TruB [Lignipirellula cremea]|uniref:tRNA pseudouridine synthase B n=1 Tax=Lignipirellula cremea TaxID=2528010 RepID=A0A518DZR2_9BACT|nr:tRNA pseudouridine(55) synthase TruB [Lignipirellula cremea]QDU97323.1 tRNA pseudouridine synthase B [Lignipirellula cremea]
MFGFLNINKPRGCTSRDVVDRVKFAARGWKVGHGGTLDPLADGVLVIALGQATRLVEYLQQAHKRYRAQFLLGRESATEDLEGEQILRPLAEPPTRADLDAALPAFIGSIQQRPPAYSAIKVQGRRAYELARKGKEVQLDERPVEVYSIEVEHYDYPQLTLNIECGKGVYVRSLGRDLAEALGDCAVMSGLTRTAIGSFTLADAISPDEIPAPDVLPYLLTPAALAVAHLPTIVVTEMETELLFAGRFLDNRFQLEEPLAAAHNQEGELVALVEPRRREIKSVRNFKPGQQ